MNRRDFLLALAAPAPASPKRPPNVIVIVADDLGWGDLAINGATDIRSPHIDGIAHAGVRFTQSYSNAPECTPTRCALLTGRYQQRVGGLECAIGVNNIGRYDEAEWLQQRGELGLPASQDTLGRRFKALGYETAITGKWHLGYAEKHWPKEHGFNYSFGILGGNADYFTHEEEGEGAGKIQMFENSRRTRRSGYMTDVIADAALDWVKRRKSKPFFLYLPFTAPHTPIQAREDFDPKTGTAPHRQRYRPAYVRMVERMDSRIGDLLRLVDEISAAGNTIVIFTSDNGADVNGRNDPYRGSKSSVWEGGIRVPLHIRWPDVIRPGRNIDQVAMTMDLSPTLLGAAGSKTGVFDGMDLMSSITGARGPIDRTVFWRYKRAKNVRRAVRHANWKYVDDNGMKSLHDLTRDPAEKNDLLAERGEIVRDLKNRLAEWERNVRSPRLRQFRPARSGGLAGWPVVPRQSTHRPL
ncbi:MAG TPA: sulfatase-like hydrolase/transferase [Bryobacteraceae bacterium]|nr:sulfatase-like hydrolase/transferase [Bryobacteraceae bacterium]